MTKKDYLNSKGTRKFQAGGPAPTAQPEPNAEQQAQIQAMLQKAVESQDPALALQVCNALYEMFTGGSPEQSTGSAPSMPAQGPEQGAPTPMGRYGMKVTPMMSK